MFLLGGNYIIFLLNSFSILYVLEFERKLKVVQQSAQKEQLLKNYDNELCLITWVVVYLYLNWNFE